MNAVSNTTLLTSANAVVAPLVAQIHAHRQTVQIGAKLTSLILKVSVRATHLFDEQSCVFKLNG